MSDMSISSNSILLGGLTSGGVLVASGFEPADVVSSGDNTGGGEGVGLE